MPRRTAAWNTNIGRPRPKGVTPDQLRKGSRPEKLVRKVQTCSPHKESATVARVAVAPTTLSSPSQLQRTLFPVYPRLTTAQLRTRALCAPAFRSKSPSWALASPRSNTPGSPHVRDASGAFNGAVTHDASFAQPGALCPPRAGLCLPAGVDAKATCALL
jgi:hypothetical protein